MPAPTACAPSTIWNSAAKIRNVAAIATTSALAGVVDVEEER